MLASGLVHAWCRRQCPDPDASFGMPPTPPLCCVRRQHAPQALPGSTCSRALAHAFWRTASRSSHTTAGALLPPAARQAALAAARARQQLQAKLLEQRHHVEELEQAWRRFEARIVTLVNSVSITNAGQVRSPGQPRCACPVSTASVGSVWPSFQCGFMGGPMKGLSAAGCCAAHSILALPWHPATLPTHCHTRRRCWRACCRWRCCR